MLLADGFTVKRLYYGEHKDWILKKHYAKRICSVSYAFGLIKDLKIIGVCTFGFPPNYNYNDGKCLFHNIKMKTLELNRLVINNSNQKNLLSYFLSSCLKLLPSPLALVSYADPNVNHTGYIYQATNWFYTGMKKDIVNRPSHYRKGKVECIDAIKSATGDGYQFYLQGNIIKYMWRFNHKNGLEDLQKAQWYLSELMKLKNKK
jgi:hypothetical protein